MCGSPFRPLRRKLDLAAFTIDFAPNKIADLIATLRRQDEQSDNAAVVVFAASGPNPYKFRLAEHATLAPLVARRLISFAGFDATYHFSTHHAKKPPNASLARSAVTLPFSSAISSTRRTISWRFKSSSAMA